MQDHALDRACTSGRWPHAATSAASRGPHPQALRVLDAAGCDVILVETVGVGQSEVEIAGLADTTLVLLAPGMGDGIQAAKAGILEVGDLYVINKSDRDGADQVRRELRSMLALADRTEGSWDPPIVKTIAQTGEGVAEVVAEIDRHREWLESSGNLAKRRTRRARDEVEAIAVTALRERWGDVHSAPSWTSWPRRSRAARPTRTPPRTSCWRRTPSSRGGVVLLTRARPASAPPRIDGEALLQTR